MKTILFILSIFFLASCGIMHPSQGKIRYVKTAQTENVIIDKEQEKVETNTSKTRNEQLIISQLEAPQIEPSVQVFTKDTQIDIINDKQIKSINKELETDDLEPDEDSDEYKQEIIDQALRAERQSTFALVFSSLGMISLIIPIVGIVFIIPGLIFYISSNNSRYITPKGQNNLKISKNLLIADFVFIVIWAALILLLLFII